jgi:ferredoxin
LENRDATAHLVIPPLEAENLVSQARRIYLRECPCRVEVQACDKDQWEVCLLFEGASQEALQNSRLISVENALDIVKTTSKRGDIHQVFYHQDGNRPYELCNCCSCCCIPLREARDKGDDFATLDHSGYVAVTDHSLCIGCGDCVDACFFKSRKLLDFVIEMDENLCFGCGCCLPECPEDAIQLEFKQGRGIPIPKF